MTSLRAVCLFFILSSGGWATPSFQSVQWGVRSKEFHPLDTFSFRPGQKIKDHLNVQVTLTDRAATEEGILLRYVFSAKIVPLNSKTDPVWAVPFLLDERHIPRVDSKKPFQLFLDPSESLSAYLAHLYAAGFWIEAIKVEIMVEPRQGEAQSVPIIQETLTIQ